MKAAFFVAYLQRNFPDFVVPYQSRIPLSIINTMRSCPQNAISERKELFIAARFIWCTELRGWFVGYTNILLDESVLLGNGVTSMEYLRVATHKILTDFICNVMEKFSAQQLRHIIHVYSKNINDICFSPSMQMTFFDLLGKLSERIATLQDRNESHSLFVKVLEVFAMKYSSMRLLIPSFLELEAKRISKERFVDGEVQGARGYFDLGYSQPIKTYTGVFDGSSNPVKDIRLLLGRMSHDLRRIIYTMRGNGVANAGQSEQNKVPLSEVGSSGTDILASILGDGIACFEYWNIGTSGENEQLRAERRSQVPPSLVWSWEEKKAFESFATCFVLLDAHTFNEVISSKMENIFNSMVKNRFVVAIAECFLVNPQVSPFFAAILFPFLLKKFSKSTMDPQQEPIILHLTKLVFAAMTLFPEGVIRIAQSHVVNIILSIIKHTFTEKKIASYFILMKSVFSSICAVKSDLLYSKITPLLQFMIESLLYFLKKAQDTHLCNMLVELLLMLPVKFDALVSYLPKLMNPMVLSLNSGGDLPRSGLQLLELCVDNLSRSVLNSVLRPVLVDLNKALRLHINPSPYNKFYSHTAARILGKLGNLSRECLSELTDVKSHALNRGGTLDNSEFEVQLFLQKDKVPISISLGKFLILSNTIIIEPSYRANLKRHALSFTKYCLPLFMDSGNKLLDNADDLGEIFVQVSDPNFRSTKSLEDLKKRIHSSFGSLTSEKELGSSKYLSIAVESILAASLHPHMEQGAKGLMDNICSYFAIISVLSDIEYHLLSKLGVGNDAPWLTVDIANNHVLGFIDAITNALTSRKPEVRELALKATVNFFSYCANIVKSKKAFESLRVIGHFATQFCNRCYEYEFNWKVAGCMGIHLIMSRLDLEVKWLRSWASSFVRALMCVLKHNSPADASKYTKFFTDTLAEVLDRCYKNNQPQESKPYYPELEDLISLIISELTDPSELVRINAKSCLIKLAELTNTDLLYIKKMLREELTHKTFNTPISKIPYANQIGRIDAVTFYLTLGKPQIALGGGFYIFVNEALALAGAQDQVLMAESSYFCNCVSFKLFRVSCIKLALATLSCSDFDYSSEHMLVSRVISTCIKLVHSKYSEVTDEACRCLKYIISRQSATANELLRICLHPVIPNLSEIEKLTLANIHVLTRFLELLSDNLKTEIGKKIFEHFKEGVKYIKIVLSNEKLVNYTYKMKITVATLSMFHLLPPSCVNYLEEVVENVISLEEHLNRCLFNPFRQPFISYLNRFPGETVSYFLGRATSLRHMEFFFEILKCPEASPLRSEAANNINASIKICIPDGITADKRRLVYLRILAMLCNNFPDCFLNNSFLREKVLALWRGAMNSSRNIRPGDCTPILLEGFRLLLEIVLVFLRTEPENVYILFETIKCFDLHEFVDSSSLKKFIYDNFVIRPGPELRQKIVLAFLDALHSGSYSERVLCMISRLIVFPSVQESVRLSQFRSVICGDIVSRFNSIMWIPVQDDVVSGRSIDTALRLEILHLTSLLVMYAPDMIKMFETSILKFIHNYIRLDDLLCRNAGCFLMARFIQNHEVPQNVLHNIYILLISAQNFVPPQCEVLVFQTLDVLVSFLSKNQLPSGYVPFGLLPMQEVSSPFGPRKPIQTVPTYISLTRQLMSQGSVTVSQLVVIYHIIMRFSDYFYEYKSLFIEPIANHLKMFSVDPQGVLDSGVLVIGICELLIAWLKRSEEEKDDGEKGHPEGGARSKKLKKNSAEENENGALSHDLCEKTPVSSTSSRAITEEDNSEVKNLVVSMLIKVIYQGTNTSERGITFYGLRIMNSIKECLTLWSNVDIDMKNFENAFKADSGNNNTVRICNFLQILRLVIENKPSKWTEAATSRLQGNLEYLISINNTRVINILVPVISSICETCGKESPILREVTDMLNTRINNVLKKVISAVNTGLSKSEINFVEIHCILKLLCGFFALLTDHVAALVPGLILIFERLVYELCEKAQPQTTNNVESGTVNSPNNETSAVPVKAMLILLLNSLSRIYIPGDLRKMFIDLLVKSIQSTDSGDVLFTILKIAHFWLSESPESVTFLKENANLMVRVILVFQEKSDPGLLRVYLNLVADILTDQRYTCTEIASQIEPVFLLGIRSEDEDISKRFLSILDKKVKSNLYDRLLFSFRIQGWGHWPITFWLRQTLYLMLECYSSSGAPAPSFPGRMRLSSPLLSAFISNTRSPGLAPSKQRCESSRELGEVTLEGFISSLVHLLRVSDSASCSTWIEMFPRCWSLLRRSERAEVEKAVLSFLCSTHNFTKNPKGSTQVFRTLLESILKCSPNILLPPLLIKYLSKKFNCWHAGLDLLMKHFPDGRLYSNPTASTSGEKVREAALDTHGEMLFELSEDDYFFGFSRQRCVFVETNCALSYEQAGMWERAQGLYQEAQKKACMGLLPFADTEQSLWVERWVHCTEKLQQWDILRDLSNHENDKEYMLECLWHMPDWITSAEKVEAIIESLRELPSSRSVLFETLLTLRKFGSDESKSTDLQRMCSEGISLILKSWATIPQNSVSTQIPLLHLLQEFTEIQEGADICKILSTSNTASLEVKHKEVKAIFQTWRERLPNFYEDINLWTNIVHLRYHIFQIINEASHPINIDPKSVQGPPNNSGEDVTIGNPGTSSVNSDKWAVNAGSEEQASLSLGFREMAWTICQFARVLRKRDMQGVCREVLTDIYALSNIKIYEAFFKFKEQVKSYLTGEEDYAMGLDMINNANLVYFTNSQRAEISVLKGEFLKTLKQQDDAEAAFYSAIRMDFDIKKGWAAWAQFYDEVFKENPSDFESGANAINCYLQATAMFNNFEARKLISRILWLLSQEDPSSSIQKAFSNYAGDTPLWYWVFFIPQLLSFTDKELQNAHVILMRIAKQYPQAMYFQLRILRERNYISKQGTFIEGSAVTEIQPSSATSAATFQQMSSNTNTEWSPKTAQVKSVNYVEEEMNVIRSVYPLLALSMEVALDRIVQRLKQRADEDIYRLIIVLLNDGVHMLHQQLLKDPSDDQFPLSATTQSNLIKFSDNMHPNHVKYKNAFDYDFVKSKPTLSQLISRFREWRDKLEVILDSESKRRSLEQLGHRLIELEGQKLEGVEVPGQYLQLHSHNCNFVKIDRLEPKISLVRGYAFCYRQFSIRGDDGSLHPFVIQHPAVRNCKREDMIIQLFRLLNGALERKHETKSRNLQIHLPATVLLATTVRLIKCVPDNISLQDVWESYCESMGLHKDTLIIVYIEWIKKICAIGSKWDHASAEKLRTLEVRAEIIREITRKYIPSNILKNFMIKSYSSYSDMWNIRKKFTFSFAALTFVTYVFSIMQRLPYRLNLSMTSGNVWTSDMFLRLYKSNEAVPFRYTPNIQEFITIAGTEGLFAPGIMAIARALTDHDNYLENFIAINIREDLSLWINFTKKSLQSSKQLRDLVIQNAEIILKRAETLACRGKKPEQKSGENTKEEHSVVVQPIIDLISHAVNPIKLAQMDISYMSPF